MIKNERQYRISLAEAERFEEALATRPVSPPLGSDIHPRLWEAEREAILSQVDELRRDVAEYDALRTGLRRTFQVTQLSDLARALIEARIASGLTHKELANRLGLPEQAIQRYESTDYSTASLARLEEIARAVGVEVAGLLQLPEAEATPAFFFKRLSELGLQRRFVLERLLAPSVAAVLEAPSKSKDFVSGALAQAAATIDRIFKIGPSMLFSSRPLALDRRIVGATRFKRPTIRSSSKRRAQLSEGYTFFAHYLALLVLQASSHLPMKRLPTNPQRWRREILDSFGSLGFEQVLRYLWGLGIPVLPLRDPGAFHGACWRTGGRNVIVLKQRTGSEDRWIFDALHEAGHLADEPDAESFEIIEEENPAATDPGEQRAMQFAADIVLDGRADELAERAVELAHEDVRFLERAARRVALEADVSLGALANFLAFRIAQDTAEEPEPISWWGTATKLQEGSGDPWLIARDILLEHAHLDRLSSTDRNLLVRSLTSSDEHTENQPKRDRE